MRALTLTQPWAGIVVSGIKRVENRPRPIIRNAELVEGPIRIAIHASRQIDESVYGTLTDIAPDLRFGDGNWYRLSRITSAIIGTVTVFNVLYIGGCSREVIEQSCADLGMVDQARWMFGPTCYLLRDAAELAAPVKCRGWQGLWTVPEAIAAQVTL